jgi:hypothetical protein
MFAVWIQSMFGRRRSYAIGPVPPKTTIGARSI